MKENNFMLNYIRGCVLSIIMTTAKQTYVVTLQVI